MTYFIGIKDFEMIPCWDHWIPMNFSKNLDKIKNMKMYDDDIIVASYPRTGTTWMQQIVYLIYNGADTEEASKKRMTQKFPFIENYYEMVLEATPPRLIKTHLSYDSLSKGVGKVVYIVRNPKDTIVSNYFFMQGLTMFDFRGTLQDMVDAFLTETDYFGPFWRNVLSYWTHKEDANLLYITYEELQQDLGKGIWKIAKFLDKEITEEQHKLIQKECSFMSMKNNDTTNLNKDPDIFKPEHDFIRKGQVGDWKNHLTEEMSRSIDKYIEEKLAPHGI